LPDGVKVLGPWRPFFDLARVWLNSDCLPYPASDADMYGTFLAREAAQYLAAEPCRPFFLYVSFYETHSPFAFPVEFRGRHDRQEFSPPEIGPDDLERLPTPFRGLSHADRQGILAAYATSTEYMDKNVGIVLDALDQSRNAENTLVLFTSDHGYLLGQHGRFEKHCCYEPAVRSALLMRYPRMIRPQSSTSALVQLIDLAPTILELCGADRPPNLHGMSLTALLREEVTSHRERIFVEYADNEEAMVRTARWKLIYSTGVRLRRDGYALDQPGDGPFVELYDLEADPGEFVNLAERPEHAGLVAQLLRELAGHLIRTAREPELVPATQDLRETLAHCLKPRDTRYY